HLRNKLGAENLRVVTAPSTPQLAFARLMLPWTRARILSLHATDAGEWHGEAPASHPFHPLRQLLPDTELIALLTSPANTPGRVARMLLQLGLENDYLISVVECLETPQERVLADMAPASVAESRFADPNVVVLRRENGTAPRSRRPVLGLSDACFLPGGKGLITKREVRVLALSNLALRPDSVIWDLGAGSGSVGLEAARLVPRGWVWAMEKDADRVARIRRTRATLGIVNHTLSAGCAPEGLEEWPDPDGVFIGGSGGALPEILATCQDRLSPTGRLVINLATLENLALTLQLLRDRGWFWSLIQAQINHAAPILDLHRLVPDPPVWIVTAQRTHFDEEES
ncbi:MAG: precorrin-6Y C5,15-methyltransferase (decarboxylating) subunit CbiT, partial [Magnetococcales bacterium]|nr:precorrin-6Y C5,15-methyltransferase (decarboxylating) subunit CbiT [Magnetococcales bacterium]